jgi:hypothetical protein
MKKITAILPCLLAFSISAHASKGGCEFTDEMYIQGPIGTHIMSVQASGLETQTVSDNHFQIIGHCTGNHDGTVVAKIGLNDNSYVELTIRESATMWNPEIINIRRMGSFAYAGTEHRLGSYDYTLKFSV